MSAAAAITLILLAAERSSSLEDIISGISGKVAVTQMPSEGTRAWPGQACQPIARLAAEAPKGQYHSLTPTTRRASWASSPSSRT